MYSKQPVEKKKPKASWPRFAAPSLNVLLLLGLAVLLWANERTATNLAAVALCVVSCFLLSTLKGRA